MRKTMDNPSAPESNTATRENDQPDGKTPVVSTLNMKEPAFPQRRVGILEAWRLFFTRWSWRGRSSRSEFWSVELLYWHLFFSVAFLLSENRTVSVLAIAFLLFILVTL